MLYHRVEEGFDYASSHSKTLCLLLLSFHTLRGMASSWIKLLHWAILKAAANLERKLLYSLPKTAGCVER